MNGYQLQIDYNNDFGGYVTCCDNKVYLSREKAIDAMDDFEKRFPRKWTEKTEIAEIEVIE